MPVNIPSFQLQRNTSPTGNITYGLRPNASTVRQNAQLVTQRGQRATAYAAEEDAIQRRLLDEQQQRETALGEIDRAYASPERMAGMEQLYGANLKNQLAGLQQGFKQTSQKTGLAAARRGRLGSSFDAEQQAGLQAGLRGDIMGAEQEAYGGLQSLRDTDEAQRLALRRSIMSGDPQGAAAFEGEARGYDLERSNILADQQRREEARRRAEQQQSQNYQTLGNVLTSAGGGVQNYYNYRGY